jgi:hypothetical protein
MKLAAALQKLDRTDDAAPVTPPVVSSCRGAILSMLGCP